MERARTQLKSRETKATRSEREHFLATFMTSFFMVFHVDTNNCIYRLPSWYASARITITHKKKKNQMRPNRTILKLCKHISRTYRCELICAWNWSRSLCRKIEYFSFLRTMIRPFVSVEIILSIVLTPDQRAANSFLAALSKLNRIFILA